MSRKKGEDFQKLGGFRRWWRLCRRLTFEALVSSFALWTDLTAFSPLVLVANSADRKSTFIAGNEELAIDCETDVVAANLADLAAQCL